MSTDIETLSEDVTIPKYLIPMSVGLSVVAITFLFWLIYWNPGSDAYDVGFLGGVNATLNGLSAICLFAAYAAIRKKNWKLHRNLMLTAVALSALFLVSYIIYHTFHGDSKFLGEGGIRYLYFAILISHIGLSAICLPLILITVGLSAFKRFPVHKKWARWTFPIWAYVSVTGVTIYVMLQVFGHT